jgi:hypothetical protein
MERQETTLLCSVTSISIEPRNMLQKNKVSFTLVLLALCTVSCTGAEITKPKDKSTQEEPSFIATKSEITLNGGDLNNMDKLLLQVDRASQSNKDMANVLLKQGKSEMERNRQEGLHGGRSGLSKLFCGSAVSYPTVDALIGCAEAVSLGQTNFEGKLKSFKGSSRLYRTALLFSDRTNAFLPAADRQKVEKNISCLDAFVKAPNPEAPGCELVRVSLLNPNLPSGKILPIR